MVSVSDPQVNPKQRYMNWDVSLCVMARQRMTGAQRREQLILIGRATFAERGFEGTTVEEIAARAGVSKPVVYEHFGGKEGLYLSLIHI